jgi:crotonobetainyl-CoA:carnitine CoA-transferase CaiB-like acyl-CoA transferase
MDQEKRLEIVMRHGVPVGPFTMRPMLPWILIFAPGARYLDAETQDAGTISMQAVAPKLSAIPGGIRWTGPRLGEHDAVVYRGLGLAGPEIARLQAEGIV